MNFIELLIIFLLGSLIFINISNMQNLFCKIKGKQTISALKNSINYCRIYSLKHSTICTICAIKNKNFCSDKWNNNGLLYSIDNSLNVIGIYYLASNEKLRFNQNKIIFNDGKIDVQNGTFTYNCLKQEFKIILNKFGRIRLETTK